MNKLPNILFLCTGNSCRSQMAEGLLRHLAGDRFTALSAGLKPQPQVHPKAVAVMRELGIDISAQRPKSLEEYLGKEPIRYLISVCDRAQQSCPRIWPGVLAENRLHWPFEDPAEATGSEEAVMAVFRRVRDEIHAALAEWLASLPQ